MARNLHEDAVAIIGLGRFGCSMAQMLVQLGHEVLAIDDDPKLVQQWASHLTHVVEADATSLEVLEQLGVGELPIACVSIGSSVEASVLVTANLVDLGVPQIWAKALTHSHGRILERIGAHHVVYPEVDAGERIARLVNGRLLDYIDFDEDFAIAKIAAPKELWGKQLQEAKPRKNYGVTIVGIKSPDLDFNYATAESQINEGDLLLVSGHNNNIEKFAAQV